jgi:GDP-L-fucose synthase
MILYFYKKNMQAGKNFSRGEAVFVRICLHNLLGPKSMKKNAKILITGSSGMVGGALLKQLQSFTATLLTPTHQELDVCDQSKVMAYFAKHQPQYVFHLAAIVGGIHANNTYPAKFIYDNTQMHCNVIHAAHTYGVEKLLFPGSACTYPKLAPQPITENQFLNGMIEPTNLAYAAAKINGIVMCQAYAREHQLRVIIPMPTNSYGVGDNFNPHASHVIPGLMQRFHQAKIDNSNEVVLWGSGTPIREFIYVDDLADAMIFLMENDTSADIINVGTMQEISIAELAGEIATVVGFTGKISLDTAKPDGAPRKCLDSARLFALGWRPKIMLQEGLQRMYQHHYQNENLVAAQSSSG